MENTIKCEKCRTEMLHRDNTYIKFRVIWDFCPNCRHEQNREVLEVSN